MEIITTIGNLREPGAFLTWAKRIVYHQCTRRFGQTPELPLLENEDGETLLDRLPDENPGSLPEQVVEDKELQALLQKMLCDLPAPQRSALMLYYYEHLSVAEIAHIQSTTEGTVKSRLNYGRKALREQVESYEKKTGVRLHSLAPLPLLLYFLFRQEAAQATAGAVGAAVGGASTAAGLGLGAKIAIGAAVAALALGGTASVIALSTPPAGSNGPDHLYKQLCQSVTAQYQGTWYAADDPDSQFTLSPEGVLESEGQTYYITWAEEESTSSDGQMAVFSPNQEALYNYKPAPEDQGDLVRLLFEPQPKASLLDTISGQEGWAVIREYYRAGDTPIPEQPPANPWEPNHLGHWESRTCRPETLEINADGTAQYAGEALRWEAMGQAYEYSHGFYKLSTAAGEHRYTLCLEKLIRDMYAVRLFDAQVLAHYPEDFDLMNVPYVDLFYRPADYPGYTKVAVTPENAAQLLSCNFETDWREMGQTPTFFYKTNLSIHLQFGPASLCTGDFIFRTETVDYIMYPGAGGAYSQASAPVIGSDTSGSGSNPALKRYTTRLQLDGLYGAAYSGVCPMVYDEAENVYRAQAVRYIFTGAQNVQGFVLVPPGMEISGSAPATQAEPAPYWGGPATGEEMLRQYRGFVQSYAGAWVSDDGAAMTLHTDGTLEYDGTVYYPSRYYPEAYYPAELFTGYVERFIFVDNPYAYYDKDYRIRKMLECIVTKDAQGQYQMALLVKPDNWNHAMGSDSPHIFQPQ